MNTALEDILMVQTAIAFRVSHENGCARMYDFNLPCDCIRGRITKALESARTALEAKPPAVEERDIIHG